MTGVSTARIYKLTDGIKANIGSTTQSLEERHQEHVNASRAGQTKSYKYMREHKVHIELVEEFNYMNPEEILHREKNYI